MVFPTHNLDFESLIPNPKPFIKKAQSLLEQIEATKGGKVLFVVGEHGRGKTELLNSLARHFYEVNTCNVFEGRFIDGKYKSFDSKVNIDKLQTAETFGHLTSTVGKLLSPRFSAFVELIGQLFHLGVSNVKFAKSLENKNSKMPEVPYQILDLFHEKAKEKPLICIIDDFHDADESYGWFNVLKGLAEEIAVDSPILFIVSSAGNAGFGSQKDNPQRIERIAKDLFERDLAEYIYIEPVSLEEIENWIPFKASHQIIKALYELTGGNAEWIIDLWKHFQEYNTVVFNEHHQIWQWAREIESELPKESDSNLINETAEEVPRNINRVIDKLIEQFLSANDVSNSNTLNLEAKTIFGMAALEGSTFTLDTLALALNIVTDQLEDYIDDNFVKETDNPNGIVEVANPLILDTDLTASNDLARYKFVSDWHWHIFDRYAFPTLEKRKNTPKKWHQHSKCSLIPTNA